MAKPKGCTYPDCFNCMLDDCEYDGNYDKDKRLMKQTEWRKNNPEKVKAIQKRYCDSEKGKETRKRYAERTKVDRKIYMKEYLKEYSKTAKYKEYQKNYRRKNRDVERDREVQKAYYERNKDNEEFRERRREANRRYREKKKLMKEWKVARQSRFRADKAHSQTERLTDMSKHSIQQVKNTKPYEINGIKRLRKGESKNEQAIV